MTPSLQNHFQFAFSKGISQGVTDSKKSYLFMHPSKMKTLNFEKDSLVLLHTNEGQLLLRCWPNVLLEPKNITSSSFDFFQDYFEGDIICDSYNLFLGSADTVILDFDKYNSFMDTEPFKNFIKGLLNSMYIREGLKFNIFYLGRSCCFTIKTIFSYISQKVAHEESFQNICENLSSLNINCDDSVLDSSYDENAIKCSTPISTKKSTYQVELHKEVEEHSTDIKIIRPHQFYILHVKTKIGTQNTQKIKLNPITFHHLGGLKEQISTMKSLALSLLNQDSEHKEHCHGIILVGASGTGKTAVVQAMINEFGFSLFKLNEVISISNEVECKYELKKLYNEVLNNTPSVLFFDNIDDFSNCNGALSSHESIVTTFLSTMIHDLLNSRNDVLVIGASRNIASVDSSLRKPGTLEKEINFGIPSANDRKEILTKILDKKPHNLSSKKISELAALTHGFTGGDLKYLCDRALISSHGKNLDADACISFDDLKGILKGFKPSSMAEFMFEVPKVKWNDIGGMHAVKTAVTEMVEWPLKHAEQYQKFKITPSRGILLYGPPGCSKTMIAKALVSEGHLNFISIKGPQLFNKYVGESEKAVSELFKKARTAAPCVIFFDEIDSLTSVRGSTSGNSNVTERILTQLLVEIDGIDVLQGVSIIAATNRPDMIDPSFLRPGRFDQMIYVPLPDCSTRKEIFEAKLRNMPISSDVDISHLVEATEGYTGAEITEICSEAAISVIKDYICRPSSVVTMSHFLMAMKSVVPRTSKEMIEFYENYNKRNLS